MNTKPVRFIECNMRGCTAKVACTPDIVRSGWVQTGTGKPGDWLVWYWCPDHAPLLEK